MEVSYWFYFLTLTIKHSCICIGLFTVLLANLGKCFFFYEREERQIFFFNDRKINFIHVAKRIMSSCAHKFHFVTKLLLPSRLLVTGWNIYNVTRVISGWQHSGKAKLIDIWHRCCKINGLASCALFVSWSIL